MHVIIHPYYEVALAPGVAALVGITATWLWARREVPAVRIGLAVALAATTAWATVLLGRANGWNGWLIPLVTVAGAGAALALVWTPQLLRTAAAGVATAGLLGALAAPAAATVATAATAHSGSLPSASPVVATGARGRTRRRPTRGGMGGLLDASDPSDELVALLLTDASRYTWAAATIGANNAAGPQLATGLPVLAVGGFNGSDPSPTLAQFQQYVADGQIHWFIAGGGGHGGGLGGEGAAHQISAWVEDTFGATTVDGATVYDLSDAATVSGT